VTYINPYEHCIFGYFLIEAHSPKISTELDVNLTQDIHKDSVFVLINNVAVDKLGNDRAVSVDVEF
jgi:hypothetical protein